MPTGRFSYFVQLLFPDDSIIQCIDNAVDAQFSKADFLFFRCTVTVWK